MALTATFLGSAALFPKKPTDLLQLAAVLPLGAFCVGVFWAVRVLQPTSKDADPSVPREQHVGLRLSLDANSILGDPAASGEDTEGIYAAVARAAQHQWTRNVSIIDEKLTAFTTATWALLAQVVLWIALLVVEGVTK
jgi:hypothetical protein